MTKRHAALPPAVRPTLMRKIKIKRKPVVWIRQITIDMKTHNGKQILTQFSERQAKTREIIRKHKGELVRSEPMQDSWGRGTLEFWVIKGGMILLQHWSDGSGTACYADWPLGETFEQLELEIIKRVESFK